MSFSKIDALEEGKLYTILDVFRVKTKYGDLIMVTLDEDVKVHLPPRYARWLFKYPSAFKKFERDTQCLVYMGKKKASTYTFAKIKFPTLSDMETTCFCKDNCEKCACHRLPGRDPCTCTQMNAFNFKELEKKVKDSYSK